MQKLKNYLNLILGLFLAAFSFSLFLAPYNFAAGGVSGLALIIHKLIAIDESLFILIVNTILLGISYLCLGKEKTKNTILGALLFPIFVRITEYIVPYIKINDLEHIVIAVLGGILSGIGYGLVFKSGFTSGGTDILNQIIEKYFHMPISKSIIIVDGLITITTGVVFDFSTMLYALIALVLISVFSNKTIVGVGESKTLYIHSPKYEEIKYYLHQEMKVDSTDFDVVGGYSKKKGKVILTVINTNDYYRIKEAITIIDPNAFITATNAYQLVNENMNIKS